MNFGQLIISILISSCLHVTTKASCSIGNQANSVEKAKANDAANYFDYCENSIRKHVKVEFQAALQYLLMQAYFDQDNVNLPGLSKLFGEMADEERQHGIKFISYLRMRGGDTTSDFFEDGKLEPILDKYIWADGTEALRDALTMEKKVSANIREMIDKCDNDNVHDYFSADMLTGTWLEEQLNEQRKLAGLINTLTTFRQNHEELADWMFSNSLLKS